MDRSIPPFPRAIGFAQHRRNPHQACHYRSPDRTHRGETQAETAFGGANAGDSDENCGADDQPDLRTVQSGCGIGGGLPRRNHHLGSQKQPGHNPHPSRGKERFPAGIRACGSDLEAQTDIADKADGWVNAGGASARQVHHLLPRPKPRSQQPQVEKGQKNNGNAQGRLPARFHSVIALLPHLLPNASHPGSTGPAVSVPNPPIEAY